MHLLTDQPHAPKRLTTSYWPADTAEPLLETTVGGALREAAAAVPDQVGLVAAWPAWMSRATAGSRDGLRR